MNDISNNTLTCLVCDKKLKLTAIMCNCNNYYCNKHRYSENHNCNYDFKTSGRILLEKNNPLIESKKIDKI